MLFRGGSPRRAAKPSGKEIHLLGGLWMSIAHTVGARRIRVEITGEMDLRTAPRLRDSLDALIARHPGRDLVLDLTGVSFIDSAGLGVLLGRYRRLEQRGARMVLVGVSSGVHAMLALAGMNELAVVHEAGSHLDS